MASAELYDMIFPVSFVCLQVKDLQNELREEKKISRRFATEEAHPTFLCWLLAMIFLKLHKCCTTDAKPQCHAALLKWLASSLRLRQKERLWHVWRKCKVSSRRLRGRCCITCEILINLVNMLSPTWSFCGL